MADITVEEFLAAFHLRQACCRALLDLSRRQAAAIAQDDYAELLEILNLKQSLVDHLGELAHTNAALQSAWPARRNALSAEDRKCCEAVLSETESLISCLLAEEQSSSSLLVSRRDAAHRELQSLSVGMQAQHAYQPRPEAVRSRFDLNS